LRKNSREKQRRQEINDKFEHLSQLLNLGRKSKAEKFTVLAEAISVIVTLRRENEELRGQRDVRSGLSRMTNCLQSAFPQPPDFKARNSPGGGGGDMGAERAVTPAQGFGVGRTVNIGDDDDEDDDDDDDDDDDESRSKGRRPSAMAGGHGGGMGSMGAGLPLASAAVPPLPRVPSDPARAPSATGFFRSENAAGALLGTSPPHASAWGAVAERGAPISAAAAAAAGGGGAGAGAGLAGGGGGGGPGPGPHGGVAASAMAEGGDNAFRAGMPMLDRAGSGGSLPPLSSMLMGDVNIHAPRGASPAFDWPAEPAAPDAAGAAQMARLNRNLMEQLQRLSPPPSHTSTMDDEDHTLDSELDFVENGPASSASP
jgi:hypothetical protein